MKEVDGNTSLKKAALTIAALKAAKVACLYGVKKGASIVTAGHPILGTSMAFFSTVGLGALGGAALYENRANPWVLKHIQEPIRKSGEIATGALFTKPSI